MCVDCELLGMDEGKRRPGILSDGEKGGVRFTAEIHSFESPGGQRSGQRARECVAS